MWKFNFRSICAKILNLLGFLEEELLDWMLLRIIQTLRGYLIEIFKYLTNFNERFSAIFAATQLHCVKICVSLKYTMQLKICASTFIVYFNFFNAVLPYLREKVKIWVYAATHNYRIHVQCF